jgi:hypothetical protein
MSNARELNPQFLKRIQPTVRGKLLASTNTSRKVGFVEEWMNFITWMKSSPTFSFNVPPIEV